MGPVTKIESKRKRKEEKKRAIIGKNNNNKKSTVIKRKRKQLANDSDLYLNLLLKSSDNTININKNHLFIRYSLNLHTSVLVSRSVVVEVRSDVVINVVLMFLLDIVMNDDDGNIQALKRQKSLE